MTSRQISCIVCGQEAAFKKILSDIRQDMMVVGTYCKDHALEQCDSEKGIITRFTIATKIGL